jgi:LysM repeat protein
LRKAIPLLFAIALLAAACGGDDDDPTPTGEVPPAPEGPVPTATPLAQVPEPAIVTGSDSGAGGTAPGNGTPQADATYTVEAGDSLSAIAERFGVTVEAIQAANNLEGTDIFVGDELIIPREGATASPPPTDEENGDSAPPPPPAGRGGVYIVQSGDTALAIAFEYDVTLDELEAVNGGPGSLDNLQVGQEVNIPE